MENPERESTNRERIGGFLKMLKTIQDAFNAHFGSRAKEASEKQNNSIQESTLFDENFYKKHLSPEDRLSTLTKIKDTIGGYSQEYNRLPYKFFFVKQEGNFIIDCVRMDDKDNFINDSQDNIYIHINPDGSIDYNKSKFPEKGSSQDIQTLFEVLISHCDTILPIITQSISVEPNQTIKEKPYKHNPFQMLAFIEKHIAKDTIMSFSDCTITVTKESEGYTISIIKGNIITSVDSLIISISDNGNINYDASTKSNEEIDKFLKMLFDNIDQVKNLY